MTTPGPEAIVKQIQTHKATDTDLSDVTRMLVDAHAHRPGKWQEDLATANTALMRAGILEGVSIVGVNGQDLIVKDLGGHTMAYDSTNIRSHREVNTPGSNQIGGRKADIKPDGSGTVVANYDDKSGWVLAKAILESRGNTKPTNTEMANFQMELEKLNGKPYTQFKHGQEIKIPPASHGGESTSFIAHRADTRSVAETKEAKQQHDEGQAAFNKFAATNLVGRNRMNMDDITKALQKGGLTDADKRGLEFLKKNYDQMATETGDSRGIRHWSIDAWLVQQQKYIAERRNMGT